MVLVNSPKISPGNSLDSTTSRESNRSNHRAVPSIARPYPGNLAQHQPSPEPPAMGFDYFPSFSAPSFNAGATYDAMFGSAEAIPELALQKKGAGDAGNLLRNYKSGAPAGQQAAGDGVWRRGVNLDDQMGGPKAGGAAAEVEMRSSPAGGLDLLATQRRALAGGAGSRANGYEEDPPAAHRNSYDAGVDLSSGEEGEEDDEVLEAHGPRGSVRGSSALLHSGDNTQAS